MLDNRRITIRDIANDVGLLFGSCKAIFTDVLGIKRAPANIVLNLLNFEQKQRSMDIAQEMLITFNDNPDLLRKLIIGDESWVYVYNIETKTQSSQWKAFCYD